MLLSLNEDIDAEVFLKRPLGLDPLSEIAMTMYGVFCHKKCRLAESASLLEKAIEQGSENQATLISLAFVYFSQEKLDQAKELLKKARQLSDESLWSITMWGHLHSLLNEQDEAKSSLKKIQSTENKEDLFPSYLGILNFDLGEKDTALAYFETALRKHDNELLFIAVMPYYKNLREDSKLVALLNKLGLHKST